jgi:hypothetical protein
MTVIEFIISEIVNSPLKPSLFQCFTGLLLILTAVAFNYSLIFIRKGIHLKDDTINLLRGYIGIIFITLMMMFGGWR